MNLDLTNYVTVTDGQGANSIIVAGSLDNYGLLAVVNAIQVQGDFQSESNSSITESIYGNTTFSSLNITGTATLNGGIVTVTYGNGYTPPPGTAIDDLMIQWGQQAGTGFDQINPPNGLTVVPNTKGVELRGQF